MTMMFPMDMLKDSVDRAIKEKKKYYAIRVRKDNFMRDEIIIVDIANVQDKLDYWVTVYDNLLKSKHFPGVSIEFGMGADTYQEIEERISL